MYVIVKKMCVHVVNDRGYMMTLLWLVFTTILGYFIGQHWFNEVENIEIISSVIGFVIGLLIRFGAGEALGDSIGDFDGGDFGGGD